jgi:hypothetical protein
VPILREPLVHFLLLGTVIYVASRHFDADSTRFRIDAGPVQRARLSELYRQQYGVSPSQSELQHVVDQYVRSEILYREGLAMGLPENDEIVRRRIVQKIEFVNEDVDQPGDTDPAELARYFQQNRGRYNAEATVRFEQVVFSADRIGGPTAKERAIWALQSLESGQKAVPRGDEFASGSRFGSLSRASANGIFGDSQLSTELFTVPAGRWSGPFRSAYGWHLIRISERQAARPADLAEVRSRVESDFRADRKDQANRLAYRKIARKYRIVTDAPAA